MSPRYVAVPSTGEIHECVSDLTALARVTEIIDSYEAGQMPDILITDCIEHAAWYNDMVHPAPGRKT